MANEKVYKVIEDKIIELIEESDGKWIRPWKQYGCGAPQNFTSKKDYRGINAMTTYLASSFFGCPYYVTFKQINKLGYKIKKGEKSLPWTTKRYIVKVNGMYKERSDK